MLRNRVKIKGWSQTTLFLLTGLLHIPLISQTIIKGPYLLLPHKTDVSILWETDIPLQGAVYFGKDENFKSHIEGRLLGERNGSYLYQASISSLKPGREYYYRLKTGNITGSIHHFSTAPEDGSSLSFVAMGDSRSNPGIFGMINEQVNQLNPELIISMGDLVAEGGDYPQWEKFYFTPAADVIDHIPLISTLGDHEGGHDDGELFRYYLLPAMKTEKLWFSFDYGPAHFVSLDYRYPDDPEMIDWFRNDMSQSTAKWKFLYMHRPCYNLGGHRSAWGKGVWPKLFRQHKVDVVFAGHSHEYERFYPVRPEQDKDSWAVTYITTGGAGAGLYDVVSNRLLAEAQSLNHFLLVKISGDSLLLTARKMDNSIFDSLSIVKHDGIPDRNYLALVKPQEQLDLVSMFARAISFSIPNLPVDYQPAKKYVKLVSDFHQNIPFEIKLTDSSDAFYRMKPITGLLECSVPLQLTVEIFRSGDMIISRWGDISPELRLTANFTTVYGKESIKGAGIEYSPDKENEVY
jgi:predicted phosphodiesterase